MKTKLLTLILGIVLLSSCAYQRDLQIQAWYTSSELVQLFGKDQAKQLIKDCRVRYTKSNKTIRDNMRTGNIEYKLN